MNMAHEGQLLLIAESESSYLKVKEQLQQGLEVNWWKLSYLLNQEDRQLKFKSLQGKTPHLVLLQIDSSITKIKSFLLEWDKGPLSNIPILFLGLGPFNDFLSVARPYKKDFYFPSQSPMEELKSFLQWFAQWSSTERSEIQAQDAKWILLGRFLGGILHDINNPLTIVTLNMNLIQKFLSKKEANPDYFTKMEKFSGEISKAMERVTGIITEVRSFLVETQLGPVKTAPLQEIIESSYRFCRNEFKRKQIELEMVFDPEIQNQDLQFEKVRMVEILSALFLTSAQAFAETVEKEGEKETRNSIKIETRPLGEKIQLLISDNVCKGGKRYLGPGLSFCQKVRDELQGDLLFHSEQNGATWIMEIPKVEKTR